LTPIRYSGCRANELRPSFRPAMNDPRRLELRAELLEQGEFPG
jgi:hypothetical protein